MWDFRMGTWGEKDLCLFWEWAQEYFERSGQNRPFYQHGSVTQKKTQEVSIPFSKLFLKKDSLGFIMVCHMGGQLGTKVVISALGMLALYMRFTTLNQAKSGNFRQGVY